MYDLMMKKIADNIDHAMEDAEMERCDRETITIFFCFSTTSSSLQRFNFLDILDIVLKEFCTQMNGNHESYSRVWNWTGLRCTS